MADLSLPRSAATFAPTRPWTRPPKVIMRTPGIGVLLLTLLLPATPVWAQQQWRPLSAPTSSPHSVNLASLRWTGTALVADVRSPIGAGAFVIVSHEVRCENLAVRLGRSATYYPDTGELVPSPAGASPGTWVAYGPGSDGRLLAAAICRLGRERGVVPRPHASSASS